ncbi:hypothetical protein DH2020_037510 [Rehmannia glutinosa]|uniref:Uncharacterized protein n=1 Tax=Rehmannia glutinosa TaxID=99300 RepID=A0ABR0V3Z7_REHGL
MKMETKDPATTDACPKNPGPPIPSCTLSNGPPPPKTPNRSLLLLRFPWSENHNKRNRLAAMVEEEYEEESEDEWGTSWFESSEEESEEEDDEEIEQQNLRSGNEVQPAGARVNSSPHGNGTGPESVESCGDTPSPVSIQADVAASVRGELPALVRHGIPTSVQEGMRAFVRQEVLALIRQELPALVRQEVLALVRQELPALVRRVLSSFRQQGLYDLDGFYDRQLELNTTLEPSNLTDDGGRQDEMTLCDRYTEGLVSVGSSGSASIGNGNGTSPESVESCGDMPLPPPVYLEVNTTLEPSNLSDDSGRRDETTLRYTEGAASAGPTGTASVGPTGAALVHKT